MPEIKATVKGKKWISTMPGFRMAGADHLMPRIDAAQARGVQRLVAEGGEVSRRIFPGAGPGPIQNCKACNTSAGVWYRSDGFLAIILATMADSASGTSG